MFRLIDRTKAQTTNANSATVSTTATVDQGFTKREYGAAVVMAHQDRFLCRRFVLECPVADKEFLFVDESGDPGVEGNPIYILVGMHLDEGELDRVRRHLATFRYHHDVVREFKEQRWTERLSPPAMHLLEFLADATEVGAITTTGIWLDKDRYRHGDGPYLAAGQSLRFRNYMLRRLLEHHVKVRRWGESLDLVIDRWRMNLDQRRNLEDYLRGNFALRPMIASITTVDSAYADPIQVVDVYTRLIRRVVIGDASEAEERLATRLSVMTEITGGLYPQT